MTNGEVVTSVEVAATRSVHRPGAQFGAGDQRLGRVLAVDGMHGCPRLKGMARRALQWAGLAILTEFVVAAVIAAIGLLAGTRPESLFFWALRVGLCFATPACVIAAVVIGAILSDGGER